MAQTLGSVAVGTVVKINESGSPVNYLVVHQGLPSSMYDASCNGTWLLRKDIYKKYFWDSGNSNALPGADIFATMAGTKMLSLYDPFIQNAVKTVKIPYCVGNGSSTVRSGANGLLCQFFPLSGYEVGWTTITNSGFPVDGAKLSYFESGTGSSAKNKRIANLNGRAISWWLRSPNTGGTESVWRVYSDGNYGHWNANNSDGVRPAFVISQNLYVWDDGTVSQLPGPAPSSITVPANSMIGTSIPVSWGTAPGADSYILQRKVDSGSWTQVYSGTDLTFTDTAGSWTTVQYQVCGVFDGTNGAFAQSEVITVVPASALAVSGTDGDLGTITSDISYSVATDTGNPISLTLTVNGAQFFSGSVGTSYTSKIPVMDLPTGTNTIVITATVTSSRGQVTVTRTWIYTKAAQTFPGSGGIAQLTKDWQNLFPMTLAEAVKAIGGPWGGNLSTALSKLSMAATYSKKPISKYSEVKVDLSKAKSGDIINLPVKGMMTPHIVVQIGNPDPSMYDASCDGVWLLRQDIAENGQWNSSNVNTLPGSTIMTRMNELIGDYWNDVKSAIKTVKIPYCVGNGSDEVKTLSDGLECKLFPLSGNEVGWDDASDQRFPNDGAVLSYFQGTSDVDPKRAANFNGSAAYWSTRSPYLYKNNNNSVWIVDSTGSHRIYQANSSYGLRPCFLLPTTFTATYYVDTAGNVYPSQEYTTAGDFYDLWGNVIPSVKIATGSYTGTGTYGSGNENSLVLPSWAKLVYISSAGENTLPIYAFLSVGSKQAFTTANINGSTSTPNGLYMTWEESGPNIVLNWYGSSASYQMNVSSGEYQYITIG